MLGKLIEFGYECRFMEYSNTYDLDQEIIAETEKRKKREERKKKWSVFYESLKDDWVKPQRLPIDSRIFWLW